MSFRAETLRVFVASPSDLAEERLAVSEVIAEWNAQHAFAESVVLLPVRWETHALPKSGVRPQEAINRQILQTADVLVGMFWTKLGTSTGVAEAGTVEEIDKFVAAGKPALLYFSRRPVDPNRIDLKQLKKLRTFKAATYKTALVGDFDSLDSLRRTLQRDLLRQVHDLIGGRRKRQSNKLEVAKGLTDIIRVHRQLSITPEQFEHYRELFGLKRRSVNAKADNPFVGLFFDYVCSVWVSLNGSRPDEGWACTIEIIGDNYETEQFEVIGIAINKQFETAKAAIQHGKRLADRLCVECVEVREDVL